MSKCYIFILPVISGDETRLLRQSAVVFVVTGGFLFNIMNLAV